MKTIKILISMLMITSLLTFTACDNEDDDEVIVENTHDDAYVDVLTKKMNMMGNIKYLPIFFVGGEEIVEEGSSVKSPDGTEYDLHSFWVGEGKLTGIGTPKDDTPQAGTYTFTLKFSDGYTKTITDELEGENSTLPVLQVEEHFYSNSPKTIEVNWTESPEADFYCIKLVEIDPNTGKPADAKPFYKVPLIEKTSLSHIIKLDGANGWMRPVSELIDGTDYFVVLTAKKVEKGTKITGASKNFEINACSKKKITYHE